MNSILLGTYSTDLHHLEENCSFDILNMYTDSHGIVMSGESLMLGSHSGFCATGFQGFIKNKCHYFVVTQLAGTTTFYVYLYRCEL